MKKKRRSSSRPPSMLRTIFNVLRHAYRRKCDNGVTIDDNVVAFHDIRNERGRVIERLPARRKLVITVEYCP